LASWQSWQAPPKALPQLVTQLGGDSNTSFLVSDGSAQWVVRLNNPQQDAGIDRSNERIALQAAHQAGIAPALSFHSSELLVTPFVAGQQAEQGDLSDIGKLFKKIHALQIELLPIDFLQHLKTYYLQVAPSSVLEDCYQRIVEMFPRASVEFVPCHNDCLLPNIIKSGQGLVVIDWEYAAAADPAYDLAVFSSTYGLDAAQLEVLMSAYGAGDAGDLLSRVRYFEEYYRLVEILWWGIRGRSMSESLETFAQDMT